MTKISVVLKNSGTVSTVRFTDDGEARMFMQTVVNSFKNGGAVTMTDAQGYIHAWAADAIAYAGVEAGMPA